MSCHLIYRPPNSLLSVFRSEFTDLYTHYCKTDELLILGDLNIPKFSDLSDILQDFSLKRHVFEPTHRCGNILDLVMTHSDSRIISNLGLLDGLSDHSAVKFTLCINPPKQRITRLVSFRSFKRINSTAFLLDLTHIVKDILSHDMSCSDLVSYYNTNIQHLMDIHAPPIKKWCISRPHNPWFNLSIKRQRVIVRQAERRWRQSRSEVDRHNFIVSKTEYHKLLDSSRKSYVDDLIDKASTHPKAMWTVLNKLLGRVSHSAIPSHPNQLVLAKEVPHIFSSQDVN
jgi:hypothetical protein